MRRPSLDGFRNARGISTLPLQSLLRSCSERQAAVRVLKGPRRHKEEGIALRSCRFKDRPPVCSAGNQFGYQ